MRELEFYDFLINLGYQEVTANSLISANRINETNFNDELFLNIEQVVSSDANMPNAMACIIRNGTVASTTDRKIRALRLYYYFANGSWYDNWSCRITRRPETNTTRQIPVELPINHHNDNEYRFIRYDDNVENLDKVNGLISFIGGELLHIFDIVCKYISEEDSERLWRNLRNGLSIPIILSKETPTQKYTESDEYIAKKIARLLNEGTTRNLESAILEILKNKSYTDNISGSYYHDGAQKYFDNSLRLEDGSRPYIVIYYTSTNCPNANEFMAFIKNCLAHECFHFVHDLSIGEIFSKKSTHRKDVIEAAADCFALIYTMWNNDPFCNELCEKRFNMWKEKLGSSWPYANAYYFYLIDHVEIPFSRFSHQVIDKFKEVFEASHYSMNAAYNILTR